MLIKNTDSKAQMNTDFKKMSFESRCEKSGSIAFEVLYSLMSNSSSILIVNVFVLLPYMCWKVS